MNLRSHMRISFVAYDGFCHWTEGCQKALYRADNGVCVDRERRGGFGSVRARSSGVSPCEKVSA